MRAVTARRLRCGRAGECRLLVAGVLTAVCAYGFAAPAARAQAGADESFEVASIKANGSGEPGIRYRILPGGRLEGRNQSLKSLLMKAFDVQEYQVVGGPVWLESKRFDIDAKGAASETDGDRPNGQRVTRMLRSLLADRFKLRVHREVRDLPVYALLPARADRRLGKGIKTSTLDCEKEYADRKGAAPARGNGDPETPRCGVGMQFGSGGTTLKPGGVTMERFARYLEPFVSRPVLDKTGLKGIYDVSLTFKPDPLRFNVPPEIKIEEGDASSIFTSLKDQLGLELRPQRGAVEVLVIDRAEQPLSN